ncbi:hypothetical protein M422DRAFT_44352 [Sphaerobolus stellatus SS14]|nr:hypothetical protein M422DRAFT_44352 [Sphaerobolus stellatus SS14]
MEDVEAAALYSITNVISKTGCYDLDPTPDPVICSPVAPNPFAPSPAPSLASNITFSTLIANNHLAHRSPTPFNHAASISSLSTPTGTSTRTPTRTNSSVSGPSALSDNVDDKDQKGPWFAVWASLKIGTFYGWPQVAPITQGISKAGFKGYKIEAEADDIMFFQQSQKKVELLFCPAIHSRNAKYFHWAQKV